MPFYIVTLSYTRGDHGLQRGYSCRNVPYATRVDAEAALAQDAELRERHRGEWERVHG